MSAGQKNARCSICGVQCYPSTVPGRPASCAEHKYAIRSLVLADEMAELHDERFPYQDAASVSIAADHPVVIANIADLHIGNRHVKHADVISLFRDLVTEPLLHSVFCGDLYDNFRAFKNIHPIFQQTLPPSLQLETLTDLLFAVADAGRLLALCWGNHDVERDERMMGQSEAERLYRSVGAYFRGVGHLEVKHGSQAYTGIVTHNLGSAAENKFAGFYKIMRRHGAVDFVFGAHTHDCVGGWFPFLGRHVVCLRPGAMPTNELFGARYFAHSLPLMPAMVAFPNEHKLIPFMDYRDAITFARACKEVA